MNANNDEVGECGAEIGHKYKSLSPTPLDSPLKNIWHRCQSLFYEYSDYDENVRGAAVCSQHTISTNASTTAGVCGAIMTEVSIFFVVYNWLKKNAKRKLQHVQCQLIKG